MSLDDEIDRLYQLPLNEFTAARNALAKTAGPKAASVKALSKPPVAAWAINQLYWQDRKTYDALIEASESLRATHAAVLGGKRGDLRAAGKEHEEALEAALKRTVSLLADGGHPATDATRQAVAQTLRALPAADPPGRLSRALQPGGFEALAGIAIVPGRIKKSEKPEKPEKAEKTPKVEKKGAASATERKAAEREAALAKAREEATLAARELRQAEQTARRAEFEAARAARAAEKAAQRVADARAGLDAARKELDEADADATKKQRQQQATHRASEAAERDLAAAKKRAETTEKDLERLKR